MWHFLLMRMLIENFWLCIEQIFISFIFFLLFEWDVRESQTRMCLSTFQRPRKILTAADAVSSVFCVGFDRLPKYATSLLSWSMWYILEMSDDKKKSIAFSWDEFNEEFSVNE